jgi:DNA sulfur modification protein DndE
VRDAIMESRVPPATAPYRLRLDECEGRAVVELGYLGGRSALMAIERIRLSKRAWEQLIGLSRCVGIERWNVHCRWASCRSSADSSLPPGARITTNSNAEMAWKIFGGRHHERYSALLKERCLGDGLGVDDDGAWSCSYWHEEPLAKPSRRGIRSVLLLRR